MVPKTDKPLVVVSTSKASECGESQPENKMGYQNHYEAQLIANMVRDVINSQPEDTREEFINKIEDNIGIISAYGAQVRLIREYLSECKLGIRDNQIRSMVASLDSFQGQERPLILYSLTRSTTYKAPESGRVGFMKELRRLNVAFTRCQKQLVIVGDLDYLAECRHMENDADDWPCANTKEVAYVGQEYINQCAECSAICEKKFARFMRLLMQHVNEGAGNIIESEQLMRKGA
jgi:superfamily I DNA and/or RNA helicase